MKKTPRPVPLFRSPFFFAQDQELSFFSAQKALVSPFFFPFLQSNPEQSTYRPFPSHREQACPKRSGEGISPLSKLLSRSEDVKCLFPYEELFFRLKGRRSFSPRPPFFTVRPLFKASDSETKGTYSSLSPLKKFPPLGSRRAPIGKPLWTRGIVLVLFFLFPGPLKSSCAGEGREAVALLPAIHLTPPPEGFLSSPPPVLGCQAHSVPSGVELAFVFARREATLLVREADDRIGSPPFPPARATRGQSQTVSPRAYRDSFSSPESLLPMSHAGAGGVFFFFF